MAVLVRGHFTSFASQWLAALITKLRTNHRDMFDTWVCLTFYRVSWPREHSDTVISQAFHLYSLSGSSLVCQNTWWLNQIPSFGPNYFPASLIWTILINKEPTICVTICQRGKGWHKKIFLCDFIFTFHVIKVIILCGGISLQYISCDIFHFFMSLSLLCYIKICILTWFVLGF